MNFIKKWFNRVVGWIATPITKALDMATVYMEPLNIFVYQDADTDWTWKMVGRVILGGLLMLGAMIYITAGIILSIAGLTLLFGLLLPPLVANVVAIGAVGYVVYDVIKAINTQRAAEIVAEPN
jgi:hypothetical protein